MFRRCWSTLLIRTSTGMMPRVATPEGRFQMMADNCTTNSDYVRVKDTDGVREIHLSRPGQRNVLSNGLMNAIQEHLSANWQDTQLRCIIISAEGTVWSAGHDLKELFYAQGPDQQCEIFRKLRDIAYTIRQAPVPVIAKINGLVAAGGVQLTSSCDMVICSESSTFVMPSANIGVFASTPAVFMSRVMRPQKCLDMLLTGQPLTAQEALKHGLVSRVVTDGELDTEVKIVTESIKKKSRSVLALGKHFFYQQLELPLNQAYELAMKKMVENLEMNDSKEGVRSFMEKRKPNWSHL